MIDSQIDQLVKNLSRDLVPSKNVEILRWGVFTVLFSLFWLCISISLFFNGHWSLGLNPIAGASALWLALSIYYFLPVEQSKILDAVRVLFVVSGVYFIFFSEWKLPIPTTKVAVSVDSGLLSITPPFIFIMYFFSHFEIKEYLRYFSYLFVFNCLFLLALFTSVPVDSVTQPYIFIIVSGVVFSIIGVVVQQKIYLKKLLNRTELFDQLKNQKLVRDDLAPRFTAVTYEGKPVTLEQYKDKKIWLMFYRYASCPLCLIHLKELSKRKSELLELNIFPIIVFESAPLGFKRYQHWFKELNLPLLTDKEQKIYDLYGVRCSFRALFHPHVLYILIKATALGFFQGRIDGNIDRVPAHFLILPNGQIHSTYYGKNISDQISWEKIEGFSKI